MIKNIDKVNGYIIQKVLHNKTGATVRYQSVPEDQVGNTHAVICHTTLAGARKYAVGSIHSSLIAALNML